MPERTLPALALALDAAPTLDAAFVALAAAAAAEDRDVQLAYLPFDGRRDVLSARWIVADGRAASRALELAPGQLPPEVERRVRDGGGFAEVAPEPAAHARLLGLTPSGDGTLSVRGIVSDGLLQGLLALWEPKRVFGVRAVERIEPATALFALSVARQAALAARDEAERGIEAVVERVHAEVNARSATTARAQADLEDEVRRQGRRLAAAEAQVAASAGHLEQAQAELHRRGEALQARTRTLELLERLMGVASATRDPVALADGLLALLGDDLEASRCSLFLAAPTPRCLYLAAGRGLPAGVVLGRVIPFGEGVAGQVAERGEPLLVTDAVDAKTHFLRTGDDYRTAGSFISFPLTWRGDLHGVVNVGNRVQQGFFTSEDLARVRLLGLVVAAIVVENGLARALWPGGAAP